MVMVIRNKGGQARRRASGRSGMQQITNDDEAICRDMGYVVAFRNVRSCDKELHMQLSHLDRLACAE